MDCRLLLAASCLLLLPALAVSQKRVIGGEEVSPGQFPFVVSLQLLESHQCGANVLDQSWLLTTAHCVDVDTSELSVLAGTTNLTSGGSRHKVNTVVVHSEYSPENSWLNDIAIFKVTPELEIDNETIAVSRLPAQDQQVPEGASGVTMGWGFSFAEGNVTTVLQWVETQLVEQSACQDAYPRHTVHHSQLCAQVPAPGKGACNGDSGGPLLVDNQVVGLASWQRGCAVEGYPTVYTRVSAFIDWIAENMD